jgi:hypothetical protein
VPEPYPINSSTYQTIRIQKTENLLHDLVFMGRNELLLVEEESHSEHLEVDSFHLSVLLDQELE